MRRMLAFLVSAQAIGESLPLLLLEMDRVFSFFIQDGFSVTIHRHLGEVDIPFLRPQGLQLLPPPR